MALAQFLKVDTGDTRLTDFGADPVKLRAKHAVLKAAASLREAIQGLKMGQNTTVICVSACAGKLASVL
jgi:hypothetical protein